MNHLGSGIGLLPVIGNGHRVELADRIVALQHAGRIFPGYGRTGFHLGPGDFRIFAAAGRAFGYKVVNAALAVPVARIPVLHGGIFDFGILQHHDFDNGGMELVFIALRRGAAFQIRHITVFFGNNQRTLKLPGVPGVNAEIGRKFHRAADAFGNIHIRAVGKDRGIKTGEKIVGIRHDRAEILSYQFRMFFYGFGD